ncbi:hypothetical protein [Acetobacterium wieringae]|uniref:hypothetical protein n=1 Tax=Acetobacterium wieringae TaxID=52694 RepID=UPI0026ECE2B8|nr:hypothetical protein [Acetobacterium wieringae]
MKLTKLLTSVIAMMLTFAFISQSMASGSLDFSAQNPDIYAFGWLTGLSLLLIAGTIGVASINNEDRKILLTAAKFYFGCAIVTFLFAGNDSMTAVVTVYAVLAGIVFLVNGLMTKNEDDMEYGWDEKRSWGKRKAVTKKQTKNNDDKDDWGESDFQGKTKKELSQKSLRKSGVFAIIWVSVVIIAGIFFGVAFLTDEEENQSDYDYSEQIKSEETVTQEPTRIYGPGETWTVDGDFTLSFSAVNETDFRNEFAEMNPAQVIVLTYDYTNIGHEKDVMDLYISSVSFYVIDENGEIAETYPMTGMSYPQEIPIGASSLGSQEAFGLKNPSQEVMVYVEVYGNDYVPYEAFFKLPVQGSVPTV